MKRSKIIATICACVLCLGLLTVGVYAAVLSLNMDLTTQVSFNADGVYVDIDAQVYRGESYTELRALDATKYAASGKNYIIDEAGTTLGTPFTEWTPENVAFLPNARLVQYRIKFTNKSEVAISVIPAEVTTIPTNVTLKEESSETLLIEPAATAELRMNFTLADSVTTSFSNKSLKMNFEICKTSDIENPVSDFIMDTTNPQQINGIKTTYSNPKYGKKIVVIPKALGATSIDEKFDGGITFENLTSETKYFILQGEFAKMGCYFSDVNSGEGCDLEYIHVPNSVTKFDAAAFFMCSKLKNVNIPNGITEIGDYAFYSTPALEIVRLPEGVTKIGDMSFFDCGLEFIEIPSSVVSIGETLRPDIVEPEAGGGTFGYSSVMSIYFKGKAPIIAFAIFGDTVMHPPAANDNFKIYVKSEYLDSFKQGTSSNVDTKNASVNNWYYYASKITTY